MVNRYTNIIIAEPSAIVFEGLATILLKSGLKYSISKAESLDEIKQSYDRKRSGIIIINPSIIQNNVKAYHDIRKKLENTQWIGLVYAYHDTNLLSLFDLTITISDSPETIIFIVNKILNSGNQNETSKLPDILSDREIDVLKLLASGYANKEIADKLSISVNTVITHRKNISQKTGIKSVSGLTIYAVVQKLISLQTLSE